MTTTTSGDDLPQYAVRIAPAAAQAAAEYDWLKTNYGKDRAERWREELRSAWASLATLPLCCPAAPEDEAFQEFQPGPPLRTFRYQQGRKSSAWRLFSLCTRRQQTILRLCRYISFGTVFKGRFWNGRRNKTNGVL